VIYVAAVLVVGVLIVLALWLSGLLPGKTVAKGNPAVWMIIATVLAFGIGVLTGVGASKGFETTAQSPADNSLFDKGSSGAPLSKSNQSGFLGTLVKPPVAAGGPESPQTNSGGDIATMTKRLEKRMELEPNNGEGWLLLARSYLELRQHGKAADCFAKAAALLPPDASMLADWADAYVVAHDRKWDDASRKIVKQALAADKKNLKALSLAGSEAYDRADYKTAVVFWKQIKEVAPQGSMFAKLAESNIEEANSQLKVGAR
jgi:tetratricopeptide (TPR) repeat protein